MMRTVLMCGATAMICLLKPAPFVQPEAVVMPVPAPTPYHHVAPRMPLVADQRALDELRKTLFMECRSCSPDGMRAVANVIYERASKPGHNLLEVLWKRWAFTCNEPTDRNILAVRAVILHPEKYPDDAKAWQLAGRMAYLTVSGRLANNVPGATNYYAPSIKAPKWAASMIVVGTVGPHIFYKEDPNGTVQKVKPHRVANSRVDRHQPDHLAGRLVVVAKRKGDAAADHKPKADDRAPLHAKASRAKDVRSSNRGGKGGDRKAVAGAGKKPNRSTGKGRRTGPAIGHIDYA